MKKQTVMWTAIPNGISAKNPNHLQLSVVVSPRLKINGAERTTLEQFPDFLNWPPSDLKIDVGFNNGPTLTATIIKDQLEPKYWNYLFQPETFVRPYEFKGLDDRWVHSYPVRHVFSRLKNHYKDVAKFNSTDFPTVKFGPDDDRKRLTVSEWEEVFKRDRDFQESKTVSPFILDREMTDPELFALVQLFHRPRNTKRVELNQEEFDFHQMVSILGDYPVLLRKLGLVFDLEVSFTSNIPVNSEVQVQPSWTSAFEDSLLENISSKTKYVLNPDADLFKADSKDQDSKLINGLLMLDDPNRFDVMQVDVDGAAIKFLNFKNSMVEMKKGADTSNAYSLPSMRSGGLSVVQLGRSTELVTLLQESSDLNKSLEENGMVPILTAEKLVRGFCIDVWDSVTNHWHSLCQRVGSYHFLKGEPLQSLEDEGYVSLGVTQAADQSSKDLYLHESLFNWSGWSLVAPRPGKIINPEDEVSDAKNHATTEFKLETSFKPVKGSLPRLRFGHTYRLRARVMDLAGNCKLLEQEESPDFTGATIPTVFKRFDPVGTPAVILRKDVTPGESVEHLVIRSNYNTSSTESCERHIAPPRGSQQMAEQHGKFDTPTGWDKDAYKIMVMQDSPLSKSGIHPEAQLQLPYLPDPLSVGAALVGLPGNSRGEVTQVPFADPSTKWWQTPPFRLRIMEGTGSSIWDKAERILTVMIPKAEIAKVRISSYINPEDLTLMGIWSWIEEDSSPKELDELRKNTLKGQHWMLTPFREITLVHAVQQPLISPEFQNLKAVKELNSTFAVLKDTLLIDGKSTSKLEILAEWEEPCDDLALKQWKLIKGNSRAFEIPIQSKQTWVTLNHNHELGDTKYRKITYTGVATTRFSEYFQKKTKETIILNGNEGTSLAHQFIVGSSEKLWDGKDPESPYTRDQDYKIDYTNGVITRTINSKIADPKKVKVEYEYWPGPVTRISDNKVIMEVQNSARPAAPKVLCAIPAFGWEKTKIQNGVSVTRRGGGLRIYLDRPWFSSGDGELLGVVLWPGPSNNESKIPKEMTSLVTQWGKDPIWFTKPPHALPVLEHFKKADTSMTGLFLDELPHTTVNVAGHAVEYDTDQKLWYCDVEMDTGESYYPFVRLALARFQPHSVKGAHLSRVVLADFTQVAPDRLATVMRDSINPARFTVSLSGQGNFASKTGVGTMADVEVIIEKKRSGEDVWIPIPNTISLLTPTEIDVTRLTWIGQITIPEWVRDNHYRLIMKEYEWLNVDGSTPDEVKRERRLVYASTLEI